MLCKVGDHQDDVKSRGGRRPGGRQGGTVGPRTTWFQLEVGTSTGQPRHTQTLWKLPPSVMIITDASPQGLGGLGADDAVTLWSHRSQSFLETLAIWLAIRTWQDVVKNIRLGLTVRSDSSAALGITGKLSSSTPAMNALAGEIALLLEELQVGDLTTQHVPSKLNKIADWLSRPQTRTSDERPHELDNVKVVPVARLTASDFKILGARVSHDATTAVSTAWAAVLG